MAAAMLFVIEATTACGPAAPARLGGGAEVVQAILNVEAQAPDPPVPTLTGSSQPTGAPPRDPTLETNDPDFDPAPAQCKPAPMPIA